MILVKIKKYYKLLLIVAFLFFLNGCDEYNITFPIQDTMTESKVTESTTETEGN